MGTYAWNKLYSKILSAKSRAHAASQPPRVRPVRPYTWIWLQALRPTYIEIFFDFYSTVLSSCALFTSEILTIVVTNPHNATEPTTSILPNVNFFCCVHRCWMGISDGSWWIYPAFAINQVKNCDSLWHIFVSQNLY